MNWCRSAVENRFPNTIELELPRYCFCSFHIKELYFIFLAGSLNLPRRLGLGDDIRWVWHPSLSDFAYLIIPKNTAEAGAVGSVFALSLGYTELCTFPWISISAQVSNLQIYFLNTYFALITTPLCERRSARECPSTHKHMGDLALDREHPGAVDLMVQHVNIS